MDETKSTYSRIKELYDNYKHYVAAGVTGFALLDAIAIVGIKGYILSSRAERIGAEMNVILTEFDRNIATIDKKIFENELERARLEGKSKRMPGHVRTGPPIRLGPNSLVRKNQEMNAIKFELGDVACKETPVQNNR